jgi:hypothetical protein
VPADRLGPGEAAALAPSQPQIGVPEIPQGARELGPREIGLELGDAGGGVLADRPIELRLQPLLAGAAGAVGFGEMEVAPGEGLQVFGERFVKEVSSSRKSMACCSSAPLRRSISRARALSALKG